MSVFNTQKIFTNLIFFTYALSHEIKICWYMEHSEQSRTAYIRLLPIIVIVCVPIIYLYLYLSKMLYFFKIITSINSYSFLSLKKSYSIQHDKQTTLRVLLDVMHFSVIYQPKKKNQLADLKRCFVHCNTTVIFIAMFS